MELLVAGPYGFLFFALGDCMWWEMGLVCVGWGGVAPARKLPCWDGTTPLRGLMWPLGGLAPCRPVFLNCWMPVIPPPVIGFATGAPLSIMELLLRLLGLGG